MIKKLRRLKVKEYISLIPEFHPEKQVHNAVKYA